MSNPSAIAVERFNGHRRLSVNDTGSVPGVLDDADEIRAQGASAEASPIDPASPQLADAVASFRRVSQALGQARAALTSFERGLHPNLKIMPSRVRDDTADAAPKTPTEAEVLEVLANIVSATSGEPEASPRLRSEAELLIAWAEALVARDFTPFAFSKIAPATRAYEAILKSLDADPTNPETAVLYAAGWIAVGSSAWRSLAESRTDRSARSEVTRVLDTLLAHPDRLDCTIAADVALLFLEREGVASAEQLQLAGAVRERLVTMRAAAPDEAEGIEEAFKRSRKNLSEPAEAPVNHTGG